MRHCLVIGACRNNHPAKCKKCTFAADKDHSVQRNQSGNCVKVFLLDRICINSGEQLGEVALTTHLMRKDDRLKPKRIAALLSIC